MAIIKCKMCGGDLDLIPGSTVAKCEYCDTRQTVPTADNEKKLTLFSRANRLRAACEFDKAAGIYEAIVADFPEEAEAYWGLVLCKYGIEYVDDPATGKKIPTCHRSSFESIIEDGDYEQALENTDAVARKVYRDEAKQIEELRKGIVAISSKEVPYDIFICYKERDERGERTIDSVLAQDIYDALIGKGYRVFFARITLEDKLGMEYEPYIFAALNSAKVMLVIGTDYEYFNAVWVRNEWSRFLKLMGKDSERHLIPCFKGIDAYDMPKEFARLQAQDLGKIGAMQDLLRGVEKILPKNVAAVQPVEDPRKRGPAIISNVCSIGTCDYNELWPTGQAKTLFNYDEHYVVCFIIGVARTRLANRSSVKLGAVIYNEKGAKILDEEITLGWQNNYDRLSKTFCIRGSDGTVVPTGKYRAEFWVDESAVYEYAFTVTSNEEIRQRQRAAAEQRLEMMQQWRSAGLCQYCGGTIKKGLFHSKCTRCGQRSDY